MPKGPKTPKQPEHEGPEPEGGPGARSRAFLEERFTSLRKKSEAPSPPSVRIGPTGADEPEAGEEGEASREGPEPSGRAEPERPRRGADRSRRIKQYRKCQERHFRAPLRPVPPAMEEAPPMPPGGMGGMY